MNNCDDVVAFCQTVLPGSEAMLIPTEVTSWAQLAVPGMSYWASTAAQYVLLLWHELNTNVLQLLHQPPWNRRH